MAGREKKSSSSTMSGPGRKTDKPAAPNGSVGKRGLKTIDTQTQTLGPSRRSSVLPSPRSVAQKKRFSSPYAMRSESPVRVLRNGKQQRLKDTSMLDGIPIVKRTRSLMSESDTSSVVNATFNDTASVDFSGMASMPDSPLSSRQNSFLYPDSTKESQSVASTPRRGRMAKASNSETGSLVSSPKASPSLSKQKKSDFALKVALKGSTLGKKLVQTKGTKTQKGNSVINVATKETGGKRKRGKANESTDTESVSTPVKKLRKNARQVPAVADQDVEIDSTAKASPIASKNTTPAVRKKQSLLTKLSDAKMKAPEPAKLNKKLTNKAMISKKNLAVPHKAITSGKKIGRPLKMTNQQLARKICKISKNTRGKANHGIPKITKNVAMKKKNKASLKNLVKTEFPVVKKRVPQTAELKTSKSEESSSVTKEQIQEDIPEDSKNNTLQDKKQIVQKPKESIEPPTVPKTVDVSVATDTPPIRKTKKVVAANKAPPKAALKIRKTLQNIKREPASPRDGETLKTLTQVSKILMEIAEKSPERVVGNNIESEPECKTPVPLSPKVTSPLQPSSEINGVCTEETKNELTHVSPINSLATKLRRKLSQSPTVTNSTDNARSTRGSISINKHIVALPIINSLSDAAKQTSSFLKTTSDSSEPLTKKETQWKVNKKLIYHRIKPSKQGSGDKLNSSMKGRVSALLNRRSHQSSRHPAVKDSAKAVSKPSSNESKPVLKPCSETETKTNLNVPEKVNTAKAEEQKPEESTEPASELDSNENKVEANSDNQSAKTADLNVLEIESEKEPNNDIVVIPEKDKKIDNHSSLIINSSTIENNLDSDKTEIKEKEIFSEKITDANTKNIETESNESSSDISNLTPNSDSPLDDKTTEPRKEFSDDEENSFELPPLHIDESIISSSPLTSPTKQDTVESSTKPASVSEPPPSNGLDSESQGSNKCTPLPFEEEDLAAKVSVLGALGLQSNQALSEQAKAPKVPKLRLVCRPTHKKHRRSANSDASTSGYKDKTYTVCREGESIGDWEPLPVKSTRDPPLDPCTRTLLWYPRMPISNGKVLESLVDVITPEPGIGVGDGLTETNADGTEKSSEPLVIPEKSSSFGIHPGRLCKDVCCYCHNKFGLYDTPLHVAQLKGEEKQQAVLTREPLLTLESCLCDACFRHLDRPGAPRLPKPPSVKPRPLPNQICCFNNCNQAAAHPMMRKWKRRVRQMLRRDQQDPKASNWMCEKHYTQMARISSCGMCRRRHSSQQMYKLEATAAPRLNQLLVADGVPVQLNGSSYLCKKCRYYASLRLRCEDYTQLNSGNRAFLREHRCRVLKSLNVESNALPEAFPDREKPKKQAKKKVPEEAPSQPPTPPAPSVVVSHAKPPKQARMKMSPGGGKPLNSPVQRLPSVNSSSGTRPNNSPAPPRHPSPGSRYLSPGSRQPNPAPGKGGMTIVRQPATQVRPIEKNDLRRMATQNANMLSRLNVSYTTTRSNTTTTSTSLTPAVTIMPIPPTYPQSNRQDPYTFTTSPPGRYRQEFPSSSDVAMNSSFEFQPLEEGSMWQKVNATFQFDKKTRQLWHQLHAPYGSYTSFLRHLVLLETHWRNGDLALTPSASPRARQYLSSVQNRIQAYEGVPSDPETSSLEPGPLICDVRSLATESTDSWNTTPSSK